MLARINDEEMLVCGTNAYNPLCRRYGRNVSQTDLIPSVVCSIIFRDQWEIIVFTSVSRLQASGVEVLREFSGKGLSPYDPNHNSTAVFSGTLEL